MEFEVQDLVRECQGFLEFLERSGAARSGNNQGNSQTNNLTSKKENEENEQHTKIPSNKK